ncbi:hypothetical protein H0I69_06590 [Yersinia enterocolitica]|uniref:hypothetical protein n=1 Tax=Yersinia enterocolitica TaxID=630 RepID=UPI001CA55788|nr:hypothetical protein [Yersinia enterocolitica]MBW5867481.1 hypothetical protein [Yersinia enterocolitica]
MNIFSFYADENKQFIDDTLRFNSKSEKQIDPGFISLEDTIVEPIRGIDRGLNKVAFAASQGVSTLLSPVAQAIDKATGTNTNAFFDGSWAEGFRKTAEIQAPEATVTTTAGQILNGLGDVMSRAIGGTVAAGPIGGAVLAGGTEAIFANDEGLRKGLDPLTAAGKGVLDGVSLGVGTLVPAAPFAKTLLSRVASGAASNIAIGAVQRGTTAEWLEQRGYKDMAQQYKVWDATAMLADGVLGAAFGGLAHMGAAATPDSVDAALTARNAQHFREDSAPGIPTDIPSNIAHQRALETATDQINRGEPVDVANIDGVFDAHFIARDGSNFAEQPAEIAPRPVVESEATFQPEKTAAETATPEADPILRDINNADQVLAKLGDIAVRVEDESGNTQQRSAKEMLLEDEQAISHANNEAQGFMAAIECELRHGNQ